MKEKVVYVEHPERTVHGGSGLCDYYMKTIPELCVEEYIQYSKRYRMVYVTDHESEIIRWNRVKAPLGRRKYTYLWVLSLCRADM